MGWQTNMIDDAQEWSSPRTGYLWRVFRDGASGHWFATYNGNALRIDRPGGKLVFAATGRRVWWRTARSARLAIDGYDALVATGEAVVEVLRRCKGCGVQLNLAFVVKRGRFAGDWHPACLNDARKRAMSRAVEQAVRARAARKGEPKA